MESICNFSPLWKEEEAVKRPHKAIEDIRTMSLNIFLARSEFKSVRPPNLEYIITECISIMRILFRFWEDPNTIMDQLRTISVQCEDNPLLAVQGAMALWYTSSISVVTRGSHQGMHPDSEIEVDENGIQIVTWNGEHSAEKECIGNLGLMAMLLTSEVWQAPEHPKLKLATLISNATTTILFAAYMISSRMDTFNSWEFALSATPNHEGMKLFLKSAWQIAREGEYKHIHSPGGDFGTTLDEIKLTRDGNTLLSKVGRRDWYKPPFWHPGRKVPGSHWNKFMKNVCRLVFPETESSSTGVVYRLPSSALTLASPWQTYYSELRSKFDQTGRTRRVLTQDSLRKQFLDLSAATGCQYPFSNPSEGNANYAEDIEQEYLYSLPMVKKPITDFRGNLTFPFMTTAAKAMRFLEEPMEAERGLFLMAFMH